jgi:hypothetical protein
MATARSLAEGHKKFTVLTTKPANVLQPTVTELNAGIDASCAILESDFTWTAQDSDKTQEKALCTTNNANALGASNYDTAVTLFRYFDTTTKNPDATADAAFAGARGQGHHGVGLPAQQREALDRRVGRRRRDGARWRGRHRRVPVARATTGSSSTGCRWRPRTWCRTSSWPDPEPSIWRGSATWSVSSPSASPHPSPDQHHQTSHRPDQEHPMTDQTTETPEQTDERRAGPEHLREAGQDPRGPHRPDPRPRRRHVLGPPRRARRTPLPAPRPRGRVLRPGQEELSELVDVDGKPLNDSRHRDRHR